MAEKPSSEKTEPPTPHRLREARRKGDVTQSADLGAAAVLATGTLAAAASLPAAATTLAGATTRLLESAGSDPGLPAVTQSSVAFVVEMARAALPLLLALLVVALVVSWLQVGPVFAAGKLKPQLGNLNVVRGARRILFTLRSWIELLKAVFKVLVSCTICWLVVAANLETILGLVLVHPLEAGGRVAEIGLHMALFVILAFLALGVVDAFYQRWEWRRKLRMTKDEVKREVKQQEGSHEHKAERKRLHREALSTMTLRDAAKADLIVTNPTRVACALRYDPEEESAPRLLAKGVGALAARIRAVAEQEGIPIIREPPLARALYQLHVDDMIPPELDCAVEEVLRWAARILDEGGRRTPSWRGKV